jgi:hypothetical protein
MLVMKYRPVRYLVWGYASFVLFMSVCFLLRPHMFFANWSLSSYGTLRRTIVPYALGFLVSGYLIWRSTTSLPQTTYKFTVLRKTMRVYVLLSIGVLLSPYSLSTLFLCMHVFFASLLFLFELVMGFWLTFKVMRDWWSRLSIFLQLVADVVIILAAGSIHILHWELTAELTALTCFSVVLLRSMSKLLDVSGNS